MCAYVVNNSRAIPRTVIKLKFVTKLSKCSKKVFHKLTLKLLCGGLYITDYKDWLTILGNKIMLMFSRTSGISKKE